MKFGTPLAQFVQPFSQGQLDPLGSVVSPGSALATINANTVRSYSAILIHVHNPGGATVGFAKWAKVQGPLTALQTFSGAFPPQPTVAAIALPDVQTIIGCANTPGDTLTVTVQFTAQPPAGTTVFVYGMTALPPVLMRPDGRNYPIGTFNVAVTTAGGAAGTLIPAPASTERIHVKTLHITASGGNASLNATISGVLTSFDASFSPGATTTTLVHPVPPDGIILDPATPLSIAAQAGASQVGMCLYDLVPA
jgi:hypothetical protein